jgi:hypothetical protein
MNPVHPTGPTVAHMSVDFSSVRNHYERAVFEELLEVRQQFATIGDELLPDVACLALNRLPVRYVRHPVDLCFYMSNADRAEMNRAVQQAVQEALQFMSERLAKA